MYGMVWYKWYRNAYNDILSMCDKEKQQHTYTHRVCKVNRNKKLPDGSLWRCKQNTYINATNFVVPMHVKWCMKCGDDVCVSGIERERERVIFLWYAHWTFVQSNDFLVMIMHWQWCVCVFVRICAMVPLVYVYEWNILVESSENIDTDIHTSFA